MLAQAISDTLRQTAMRNGLRWVVNTSAIGMRAIWVGCLEALERRRFLQAEADIQAHAHEGDAEQERHAASPRP